MNNFIQFYTENNISPVSQNIKNLRLHFNRRNSLYRTIGLTPLLFKDRDVLEVAPGSGHNSIVTATYEMKRYDLVEPNPIGFKNMINLFNEHHIKNENIEFHNTRLEDLPTNNKYDIVLCEGLIPGLSDSNAFLHQLSDRVRPGGILTITCADAVSVLFETLRRYLSRILIYNLQRKKKVGKVEATHAVDILSDAFRSHLHSLEGMSRPVEDWVWDNLINPASASLAGSNEFSVKKCFDFFGEMFYFYGSSPVFANNYTWYKNLPENPMDYNKPFVRSFITNQLNFLNYQEITQGDDNISEQLYYYSKVFSLQVEQRDSLNPGTFSVDIIKDDLEPIKEIQKILEGSGLLLSSASINEFIDLFADSRMPTSKTISEMKYFSKAFGRGQQYISIIKGDF